MGLAQKRIVQEFQTTAYTKWLENFHKIVGFQLPVDVKWDTLHKDDRDNRDDYFRWYETIYFRPLLNVFQELCADDIGKEAVKTGVKKIVIDGTDGNSPQHSKFEGGTFFLNHKFHVNENQEKDRVKGWKKILEKGL